MWKVVVGVVVVAVAEDYFALNYRKSCRCFAIRVVRISCLWEQCFGPRFELESQTLVSVRMLEHHLENFLLNSF